MPTPLMPDEEFDAQFRLGLEHYPEQPEDPAAWHRMGLLLDADLRQQALRRRVWRLLGAETVLLVLGVWATFSFLLEKMPISAGQLPVAAVGRAAGPTLSAAGAGRSLATTATLGRATEKAILPASAVLSSKQPAVAAEEASHLMSGHTAAAKLSTAGKSTSHIRPASSADVALMQPNSAAHAHKAPGADVEKPLVARHNPTLRAAATISSRRARNTAASSKGVASEASATATTRLAGANHKLASYQGKHRLHQLAGATAQELIAATGRRKMLLTAAATSSEIASTKASHLLSSGKRHAPASSAKAGGRAAAPAGTAPTALPIDLLAARWPASGLRCQLPDSLALIALSPFHPADSLDQPKPRPLLSAYRFRVGLVGAPEFSTVRASTLTKPGSSLGVLLEYQLGRRWRVSAGYLYTNKLYMARGTDYTLPAGYTMPHGYVISKVDAACRIVDIPLNLRYDLWQRPRYQVFVSAGLSSLLMRREQYTYDYELLYGKPIAPYSWELDNGSQHVLKVLNLSAGYERAVGPRWTVQAEPFVKLPLAGVGFGAVRLSSAGVFFSLKYGLLPVHPAPALR